MEEPKHPPRDERSPHHWFHYRMRSLLLIVGLIGVLLALWIHYVEPFRAQRRAMWTIERAGGAYRAEPGGADWLRNALFLDLRDVVHADLADCEDPAACLDHLLNCPRLQTLAVGGRGFTNAHLLRLKELPELRGLLLDSTAVTPAGLADLQGALPQLQVFHSDHRTMVSAGSLYGETASHPLRTDFRDKYFQTARWADFTGPAAGDADLAKLATLNQRADLQYVELDGSRVSDAGLRHLQGFGVKRLELRRTAVTDAGLAHLRGLPQLEFLALDHTQITDAGLVHLAGLKRLKMLTVKGTQVTEAGLERLQRALPNCRIHP